jgi:hypothetical protein
MKQILLSIVVLLISATSFAQCNDLFISEYVHGYGNNRALEIYNPTNAALDLSQYQLVRYSNGGTTPYAVGLSNTLAPAECWVVVSDKQDPNGTGYDTVVDPALIAIADTFLCPVYNQNKMMYFNGNDAITIEKLNGTYVDIIGKIGEDPGIAWTADTLNGFTSAGGARWWTKRNTLIRKYGVQQGITTNPNFFNPTTEWDSLGNQTFDHLGWHQNVCQPNSINNAIKKANDCFFYPNPAVNGWFMVKGTEIISSVEVINTAGQIVISKKNDVARGDMKITTENIEAGMYVINVYFADNTSTTKKIIIR